MPGGFDRAHCDGKSLVFSIMLYRRLRKPPSIMDVNPVAWTVEGFSLIEPVRINGGVEYRSRGHRVNGPSVD